LFLLEFTMSQPLHIVSLSFDDGFEKSSIRTAEIFEQAGLRACLNVLASPAEFMSRVQPPLPHIKFGGFDLWNDLRARGHEVMPHGFSHLNKAQLPLPEAQASILRCLDVFDRELAGFDRKNAVFNFPYNATSPELEAWLATVVRACRGGWLAHGINPLPTGATRVVRTHGFGPGDCGEDLTRCVEALLQRESGWLVYNTHGLDGEGWGPLDSDFLRRLLERLQSVPSVRVWSVGETLTNMAR